MSRLVVVSNRLPHIPKSPAERKAASAGGLVSALLPVMQATGEGLWMGWSGRSGTDAESGRAVEIQSDCVRLVALDLSEAEVDHYYNGFCNRTLWPMFHCFPNRVRLDGDEQEIYVRVNRKFSRALARLLRHDDIVWVHDYHLAPLGMQLREDGFRGPIGFFLHIPFPPLEMIEILPDPVGFMRAWLDYDLVGFHNERYRDNYVDTMTALGLSTPRGDGIILDGRRQRTMAAPIGINPGTYEPTARSTGDRGALALPAAGCRLVLGVDRLDYTKGIPERLTAFERLLRRKPQWRKRVCLVQVCSPSRTRVREYREQKAAVDALVGRINGEFGEHDWLPIRYLYRTYTPLELTRFYRQADVALITPLRDGMNLVALEYMAAQPMENPGVLVLSRFTGASGYLPDAIQVNPYLPESMAEGIDQALRMPLPRRRRLHRQAMRFIRHNTAARWANQFLGQLLDAAEVAHTDFNLEGGKKGGAVCAR